MNELAEANQAYGALAEGFYVASHTFERAMAQTLQLLKTGQWKVIGDGFDDINKFVRTLKLHQFGSIVEQRREFVEQIKRLELDVSNRAAAEALGVSHATVNRWQADGPNRPLSGGEAAKYLEEKKRSGTNVPLRGAAEGRRDALRIIQRDARAQRRDEKLARLIAPARLEGLFSIQVSDRETCSVGPLWRQMRWRLGEALAPMERGAGPGRGKKDVSLETSFRELLAAGSA